MSKRMIDSELIESLNKDIQFDGMGNVIVGKNLEVDGKMQLNGGIKPIHTYKLDGVTNLYVYFKDVDHDGSVPNDFLGYGWIERMGNGRPCMFYYALQDGRVSVFKGLSSDTIYEYSNNTMKTSKIAKASECQAKLYRHIITMVANTEEGDPETSIIEYISTNNLKVASLQDLTTLLKPTANFIYPLGPVVNADLGGITDYNQLEYSNGVWKFAGPASNITKINVVSVSDTVTPL